MDKESPEYAQSMLRVRDEFLTLSGDSLANLPIKRVMELRNHARSRTDLTKSDAELTNEQGAWKFLYQQLDGSLLQTLGTEEKAQLDMVADKFFRLDRGQEVVTELCSVGRKIEDLFIQQYDRIAFHHNDSENEYKIQEPRLSGLMLDKSLSNEKHKEHAEAILKLVERYKEGSIGPLHKVNDEIRGLLDTFEGLLEVIPAQNDETGQALATAFDDMQRWFSLSKRMQTTREKATASIEMMVELDEVVPIEVIKNSGKADIALPEEIGRDFKQRVVACSTMMKESIEENEKIQADREPLTKQWFTPEVKKLAESDSKEDIKDLGIPAKTNINPLEGKTWFRFAKTIYIILAVAGVGLISLVAVAANSWGTFFVGLAILLLVLFFLRKGFYYIALGRTTAKEKSGSGFADIDDLCMDFANARASHPDLYEEVIVPYLESWKKQYGRRIPLSAVDELRKRMDKEVKEVLSKKEQIIADAAKKGATIEIAALRQSMEKAKAEYSGPDREQFIQAVDRWILTLESKYGTAIPINEASKLLDSLDADDHKQEHA
jgi:hypothetical protein